MIAQPKNLEIYRTIAQFATVGAAAFYVALWIIGRMVSKNSTTDFISQVLISIVFVGGMLMGLLYFITVSKKK